MLKRYLLAPGPTPVPPEVLLAMARPMIHHRAPEFDKHLCGGPGWTEVAVPDEKQCADAGGFRNRRHGRFSVQLSLSRRQGSHVLMEGSLGSDGPSSARRSAPR